MNATKDAPTIASQQPQGLWEFASAFWGSFEMQILIGLVIAGIIGQIASYIVKWARKEIQGNIVCYLFIADPQKTLLTFIGYLGLMIAAVGMDAFTGDNGSFVGWRTVIWFGLMNGFALDYPLNKGETKVWTEAERAAERAKQQEKEKP